MSQFEEPVDPINFAIDHRQEKIAKYLVEKAFSLHHTYLVRKSVFFLNTKTVVIILGFQ